MEVILTFLSVIAFISGMMLLGYLLHRWMNNNKWFNKWL